MHKCIDKLHPVIEQITVLITQLLFVLMAPVVYFYGDPLVVKFTYFFALVRIIMNFVKSI